MVISCVLVRGVWRGPRWESFRIVAGLSWCSCWSLKYGGLDGSD